MKILLISLFSLFSFAGKNSLIDSSHHYALFDSKVSDTLYSFQLCILNQDQTCKSVVLSIGDQYGYSLEELESVADYYYDEGKAKILASTLVGGSMGAPLWLVTPYIPLATGFIGFIGSTLYYRDMVESESRTKDLSQALNTIEQTQISSKNLLAYAKELSITLVHVNGH